MGCNMPDKNKTDKMYGSGEPFEYTGEQLKTIGFPIGGISTGNIVLGGRGNIKNIEIFNKVDKINLPSRTFFSIWVQEKNNEPVAKILERKILPPYEGWMGFPRDQLSGVARFEEIIFKGEYPFANLKLIDEQVPVNVELEAYNPYIPLSPEKSGIPAAIFNWKVKNPGKKETNVSIAFSMFNPILTRDENNRFTRVGNINQFVENGKFRGIKMSSKRTGINDLEYGNLAFVTTEEDIDVQTRWYRGGWWDECHIFWDDFANDGRIKKVTDEEESNSRGDVASLLVHFNLKPGEEKIIPFYLTWYFPNRENNWSGEKEVRGKKFKNYYSNQFNDAFDVAQYLIQNIEYLYLETKKFHDIVFNSTYPSYVIDAISANTSSLKTNLVIWNEKGQFYGFEGLTDNSGCCQGSCTHVWNYEQTLAFLFPSLERSMREITFLNDTWDNGYQTFRTLYPPGDYWWKFHPATDGQMGGIVRVYREWKISGDTEWLKKMWPKTKAALEFAWKGVGEVEKEFEWQKTQQQFAWDPDKDGIMEGMQHNTYDIEFYGPNTMIGSLYLTALKAASEMAEFLGETDKAKEYYAIFEEGSEKYDEMLWKEDYYVHKIDIMEGLTVPEHLKSPADEECNVETCEGKESPGAKKKALEKGEIIPKYQYGDGCLSDQLLGQYLAHVAGLGYVLNREHVDKAMESIYKYNFREKISEFSNVQRVYALNDEAGLLLCSWPKGNRPALPFVYSDEVWTGIEYQVAASLIYSGHINEGLNIVKAVRERHRGFNRNPWDEFECGHHYARAMASWAVLLSLSGYQYDGVDHTMAFSPQLNKNKFYTFWSSGNGWGSFNLDKNKITLKIEYGKLKLSRFGISKGYGFTSVKKINIEGKVELNEIRDLSIVQFSELLEMKEGEELIIVFNK